MFEDQTYEVILQRMLDNLSSDIDKREGSVAYDMLAPKAAELAQAYIELDNVLNFGFVNTTYGEFLDNKVSEAGITRISSVQAKGIITFTSDTEGLVIDAGSICYTDSGIQFTTDASVTIIDGTASTNITAVNGGLDGNVPANSIINTEVAEAECNNIEQTSGGADEETDENLLVRYYSKVQAPATSGNAAHYKQWALEIDGIGDARVVPLWNGNGTVKIILIDSNKRAVTTDQINTVAAHIEDVRPIGSQVTVVSAVEHSITISVTLSLLTGYTNEIVLPVITQSITEYFQQAAFVDSDIKYSKIGTIILETAGVSDYSNLTINSGTSNIPMAENETPVLGVVNLS